MITGRPVKPRSAAERVAFLHNVLGFGRDRREILIAYDATQSDVVTIVASQPSGLPVAIGEGRDLEEALDRAISRNPKWRAGEWQK